MRKTSVIWLCGLLSLVLGGCTTPAVRQAEAVVAQADSLWQSGKMYGIDEGDSASLAQACETLSTFNSPLLSTFNYQLSTDFSRLCYHYGRLLREKDNPVAAMQVFIDATHSRTRDYHILGRVYSNIGDLCHLAGNFPLSYDMFSRSADCFLKNGDTLLYYYGLNNMAFELAEQAKEQETLILLDSIVHCCNNKSILSKTLETKSKLYFQLQLYDSVINITNVLQSCGDCAPTSYELKARGFWHTGNLDSALCYANYVLSIPTATEQNKYNMYYILANGDSTINNEGLLAISAQRSDIETDVLIPLHNQLAVAVQLLEQDLTRKPDLRWLYAIIATAAMITCIIGAYVYRKRKKLELLTQKIDVLEKTANSIQEKKDELSERYLAEQRRIENEIKEKCELLRNDSKRANTLAWNDFDAMCRIIDRQFYMLASKLRNRHILNETETRLCILVLLELSRNEIAQTLPYALNGVGKLKDHTAKKLGTTGKNLHDFLLRLAVEK
ncbi:MAG: hypothetical protein IJP45_07365 [Paludibacteraceae bacterium]|nr:hypothetical protein [Paludibacteraceae bacterium]